MPNRVKPTPFRAIRDRDLLPGHVIVSHGPARHLARAPSRGECSVKIREIIRILHDDGWRIERVRGSHRQLRHSWKRGTVTVAGHPNQDLTPGMRISILRQAGLR
ncbi:MAG: type II toxin-antitoxin system HicA family toxin [Gemmatimonadales bacterium]